MFCSGYGDACVKEIMDSRREPSAARPPFAVLIGNDDPLFNELLTAFVERAVGDRAEVRATGQGFADDVLDAARRQRFDLFVLFLNNIRQRAQPRLLAIDRIERAVELIPQLKAIQAKPIVAISGWHIPGFTYWVEQAGADVLLIAPVRCEDFVELVQTCCFAHDHTGLSLGDDQAGHG